MITHTHNMNPKTTRSNRRLSLEEAPVKNGDNEMRQKHPNNYYKKLEQKQTYATDSYPASSTHAKDTMRGLYLQNGTGVKCLPVTCELRIPYPGDTTYTTFVLCNPSCTLRKWHGVGQTTFVFVNPRHSYFVTPQHWYSVTPLVI